MCEIALDNELIIIYNDIRLIFPSFFPRERGLGTMGVVGVVTHSDPSIAIPLFL